MLKILLRLRFFHFFSIKIRQLQLYWRHRRLSIEIMGNSSQQQNEPHSKILIIDDDPAICGVIADYLSNKGFVVLEAEDGTVGLNLFARENPDLVLLDLRLPGMDGLEILSCINKDSPDTPVVIVSGQGTIKDAIAALKTGAWDYITKPIFDMNILNITVNHVLERAKQIHEKNNYQFYTADMNTRAFEFLLLESDLRKALDNDELVVHFQPVINLEDKKLISMEALLRWKHPKKGMVSPADFIPLAEETGLIESIGEWVLRAACAQNKKWQDAGYPPVTMSVNMSARQFNKKNVVETIGEILEETGLRPEYFCIEITESIIMKDVESTITKLNQLHKMGISLSIDDFGTGYSSLNYLKLFPIDNLKIDRSFVFNITSDSTDAAIAASVILLAHSMNLKVTAEGVETNEQLEMLRRQGCDYVQGFLFSKPIAAEKFAPFFASRLK